MLNGHEFIAKFNQDVIEARAKRLKKQAGENWENVIEYELLYQVSNMGNVKSLGRKRWIKLNGCFGVFKERILKPTPDNGGYLTVTLCKNGSRKTFKVSVLVAMAFLNHKPNGHKIVVDHKNNIKTDDRLINLQLLTSRENSSKDTFRNNPSSKYTGVCWYKRHNKWGASIKVNGKSKNLGYFIDELEAHGAYKNALEQIRKEESNKYFELPKQNDNPNENGEIDNNETQIKL